MSLGRRRPDGVSEAGTRRILRFVGFRHDGVRSEKLTGDSAVNFVGNVVAGRLQLEGQHVAVGPQRINLHVDDRDRRQVLEIGADQVEPWILFVLLATQNLVE
jgi:hypothetical protein